MIALFPFSPAVRGGRLAERYYRKHTALVTRIAECCRTMLRTCVIFGLLTALAESLQLPLFRQYNDCPKQYLDAWPPNSDVPFCTEHDMVSIFPELPDTHEGVSQNNAAQLQSSYTSVYRSSRELL